MYVFHVCWKFKIIWVIQNSNAMVHVSCLFWIRHDCEFNVHIYRWYSALPAWQLDWWFIFLEPHISFIRLLKGFLNFQVSGAVLSNSFVLKRTTCWNWSANLILETIKTSYSCAHLSSYIYQSQGSAYILVVPWLVSFMNISSWGCLK